MEKSGYRNRIGSRLRGLFGGGEDEFAPEFQEAMDTIERSQSRFEESLQDLVLGEGMPASFHPGSHLAPGLPRLRPVLVNLASRAAGEENPDTIEVAHAAELLHLAVAVHDAALGRQGGRRRRVARRLVGGAAHWLGGNHLSLRVLEMAQAAPTPEILDEVLGTMRELAEGHALAEDLRHRDATEQDYLEYAEGHSGAVLSFCTRSGGHLARAPRDVVGALGRYGRHVGIAWHGIEDQWLMQLSSEDFTRELAERASRGRPTLPLIRALVRDPAVDETLDRVLAGEDDGAAEELAERIYAAGGVGRVRKLVLEEAMGAKRSLKVLEDSPYKEMMDRIASRLTDPDALAAK